jgi:hypothetical protein
MKIRLLALTSPNFSPCDVLLTELPSYTQTEGGSSGFAKCDDNISISSEEKSSFIKTNTIFPFSSDLQYNSETIAVGPDIHYVVKLNV